MIVYTVHASLRPIVYTFLGECLNKMCAPGTARAPIAWKKSNATAAPCPARTVPGTKYHGEIVIAPVVALAV